MSRVESKVDPVRSANMARIRGKDTKPEMLLRKELWKRGFRYRVNHRICSVRPDLVFIGSRLAVFIDGCFWHGCPVHYVRPKTRSEFWSAKLKQNVMRDSMQTLRLEESGWSVLRFWEHEIKDEMDGVIAGIKNQLDSGILGNRTRRWHVLSVTPEDKDSQINLWELVDLRDPGSTTIEKRLC